MAQYEVRRFQSKSRYIERRNAIDRLAADTQDFTAGRENRDVWAQTRDALGKVGRSVDDVLAIIEYNQKMFRADGTRDRLRRNLAAEL